MHILERLADFIAPDNCLSCGREGCLLCDGCQPLLPSPPGTCFSCNMAVHGVACSICLPPTALASIYSATHYIDKAKLLVASLKFRGNQSAARCMADVIMARAELPSDCLLVHMPATTAHVRERGFDQSQLIVRHISRKTGLPRADVLRRTGSHHQLGANRTERLQQLKNSLSVAKPNRIVGKHIILIDDVLTTGSSLTTAAAVLRKAGASSVRAFVFAQSIQ